ncbi:zinc finger protein 706 [Porphyrio hochstetteri]
MRTAGAPPVLLLLLLLLGRRRRLLRGRAEPFPPARQAPVGRTPRPDMARGQQKIQSQQKNAKKQAEQKKKQGHDQKAAAKAALIYTCTVCRTQMPDPKTFKQHFESKHPKTPLPPELADVQA